MVVKAIVQQAIYDLLIDMRDERNQDEAILKYADKLSTIIVNAILSAEVTETPFNVIGTSPAGAVTGTATQLSKGTLQ